jgi:hypothetical protein
MKKFEVKIVLEVDSTTVKEGLAVAKQTISALGLKAVDIKPVLSSRTLSQNSALHLFFTQLAQELNNHGLDMRHLIRQEVEISWNAYSVKEYLWKPLQKVITGKKSTTKLNKSQEINIIYDNLNRIIVERSKGQIDFPPFPCLKNQIEEDEKN